MGRSASHPISASSRKDDDIVRPLEKSLDTCNQFVAGSSPAAGAHKNLSHTHGVAFVFNAPAEKVLGALASGLENLASLFGVR
jgi:hypothetical protein